jgi:hypothetical protein
MTASVVQIHRPDPSIDADLLYRQACWRFLDAIFSGLPTKAELDPLVREMWAARDRKNAMRGR